MCKLRQFQPFTAGALTVYLAGQAGGCAEHPCALGHSCKYVNYSLTCSKCSDQTVSIDGRSCVPCPAGQAATQNQSSCVSCTGNDFSTFGVCQPCHGVATIDHTACEPCPFKQVPTLNRSGCICDKSYAVTDSVPLHICFHSGWENDQVLEAKRRHAAKRVDEKCDECPTDITGTNCLVCSMGSVAVAPGFIAPENTAVSRRLLASTRVEPAIVYVFRCHHDITIATVRCPGSGQSGVSTCAPGYQGQLCGECADDFGMNREGKCEACEEMNTGSSLLIFVGMIIGVALFLALLGKVWKGFPLKHLLRCSIQPARILITYSQVTSQLGDVLDFQYPGLFGDVLTALKPVMDVWGLLFRAIGPSECFGVQGFTSRWLLRVVGLPTVMGVFVLVIFVVERWQKDRYEASINAKGNLFFVIFFCYPTICIVSFAAFICKQMNLDESVLEMDDEVSGHFVLLLDNADLKQNASYRYFARTHLIVRCSIYRWRSSVLLQLACLSFCSSALSTNPSPMRKTAKNTTWLSPSGFLWTWVYQSRMQNLSSAM
jgi:hypothetical protein